MFVIFNHTNGTYINSKSNIRGCKELDYATTYAKRVVERIAKKLSLIYESDNPVLEVRPITIVEGPGEIVTHDKKTPLTGFVLKCTTDRMYIKHSWQKDVETFWKRRCATDYSSSLFARTTNVKEATIKKTKEDFVQILKELVDSATKDKSVGQPEWTGNDDVVLRVQLKNWNSRYVYHHFKIADIEEMRVTEKGF